MARLVTSVLDVNKTTIDLTGDNSVFIKYHSNAEASMSIIDGAMNLDACVITHNGERAYNASHIFYNVEDNLFHFSTLDTDNNNYSKDVLVNIIDYIRPTCNFSSASIDGDGNATIKCNGNFFNDSFGNVMNIVEAKCRYKESGGGYSEWHEMNTTQHLSNTYSASLTLGGLNYRGIYTFEISVNDRLEEKTATKTVTGKPLFHWGKNRFTFETPVEFVGGNVIVEGGIFSAEEMETHTLHVFDNIRLQPFGKNYGGKLIFGDGNYCYIGEESNDSMTIYASNRINLKSKGGVRINGADIAGSWIPAFEDEYAINYNIERDGWYSKVENIVTIGFRIKVECYSGYHTTPIKISNLPFLPSWAASGGGMCSGAYVSGGRNFQCFVAETDGTITTRVQSCNNTSNANLATSSSGCFYPNGGGELTLSGTITYTISE